MENFNKLSKLSWSWRDQVQTVKVQKEVAEELLRSMEDKLRVQVDSVKKLEKELIAEKEKTMALEAKL